MTDESDEFYGVKGGTAMILAAVPVAVAAIGGVLASLVMLVVMFA